MRAGVSQYHRDESRPEEDGIVVLRGVTWADYERLLEIRGDHSAPRFNYDEGDLEIMSPSRSHEGIKSAIGCLVEAFCFENDVEFDKYGSWTLKKKRRKKGAEPDECYVFGGRQNFTYPDLVIEVVWTSGRIDKLGIYQAIGVREVWYWRDEKLEAFVLGTNGYKLARTSKVLPGIDLAELAGHIDRPTMSGAVREYAAKLRAKKTKKR
jgi:Uma2 family endonuclease